MAKHGWHQTLVDGHVIRSRVLAPRGVATHAGDAVLVHGLAVSSRSMVPLLERLGTRMRTWAPDLPGHGRSTKPPETLGMLEQVDVLRRWLQQCGIEQPLLVANSWGCQLVVELAARGVDVRGLVLVGPVLDQQRRSATSHVARLAIDQLREPARLVVLQAADCVRTGPMRTARELHAAQHCDIRARLPQVEASVIVARGSRDTIVPRRWAREVADSRPGTPLVEVPGHGHCIHWSEPGVVADLAASLAASGTGIWPAWLSSNPPRIPGTTSTR